MLGYTGFVLKKKLVAHSFRWFQQHLNTLKQFQDVYSLMFPTPTAITFRLKGILETIARRFQDFLSGLRRRSIV